MGLQLYLWLYAGELNVSRLYITYPLNVLHLQPLQYPIHSCYSLHTTSLKYNTVLHLIDYYAGKRLLYHFCRKGDVPTRMGYGDEYKCSCISVQIVVGQCMVSLRSKTISL